MHENHMTRRRARFALGAVVFAISVSGASAAFASPVKNADILCRPHGGVEHVGENFVVCKDGTVFELPNSD